MPTTYDAIVIGARCGGAATAMLLARDGLDVLLVDRATFPSDIPHGHFIHRHGPRRLADWGLLDRVLDTGCPPIDSVTQDLGDFPLTGTGLAVDGVPFGLAPRRDRLDQVLVEAAVEAGAELRDGFAVLEHLRDGDRVTGVRGRDVRGGGTVEERAAIVIGADGRNSGLARAVGAPASVAAPTLTCWFWSYFAGLEDRGLEMHLRDRRIVFAFPTNDGLHGVFIGWPANELASVKADVDASFTAVLDGIPGLGERVRASQRVERHYGATQLPNFIRRPYGPGWALVGDAGCHKDPFLALGVCDALRDAELLAGAVVEGLGGAAGLPEALAGYEARRDAATLPDYHQNLAMASLDPAPEPLCALRASIRADQDAVKAYFLDPTRRRPVAAAA